ncbi:MAG: hypothetical protein EVB05_05235 [Candidatus Thioglobus sp.]|nr:MAG: hypothetical protein EVB05_05235 [Candidatus Thioglobus sp.]
MFDRLTPDALEESVNQLESEPAIAIDCLSDQECQSLVSMVDELNFRNAMPVTGSKQYPVHQDFELDYCIPEKHALWQLPDHLGSQIFSCLLNAPNVSVDEVRRFRFNDLIVQRYPSGCQGISPHRDRADYRLVIGILLLSGDGNFRIHHGRDENRGQIIPFNKGQLLLMGAPGLSSDFVRPFHSVREVSVPRRTIGMRFDRELLV